MPIRPENKHRYPADWKQIRARILARAGHRCEKCGVVNHAIGYREADGLFVMADVNSKRCEVPIPHWAFDYAPEGVRLFEIVLTVAHLDHVPENCDPANLRAWCQRCHLAYDKEHHAQTAYTTRRSRRAAGDLFEGGAA